jgi:predicted permease
MGRLFSDLRFGARVLARRPGVTSLAVLSLALGLGVNTAVFSVVDAWALRPLDIRQPSQIARLAIRESQGRELPASWIDVEALRQASPDFKRLFGVSRRGGLLSAAGIEEDLLLSAVTPNYFDSLGVRAQVGRLFHEGATDAGALVLSDRTWRKRFGADPGIVGRTVFVNRRPLAVIGVLPSSFAGLQRGVPFDLWVSSDAWHTTLQHGDARTDPREIEWELFLRTESPARNGALAGVATAVLHQVEDDGRAFIKGRRVEVGPFDEESKARTMRLAKALLGVVVLVLIIACANVANLRVALNESRRKEIGIRVSLGAARWDLVRQMLVEGAWLAAAGAALGLLLAVWLLEAAPAVLSGGRDYVEYGVRLDGRVLAWSAAATLLSVLLTGLAPLADAFRQDVVSSLKGDDQRRRLRFGSALAAAQVALSMALTVCGGLFLKTLQNVSGLETGFAPGRQLLLLPSSFERGGDLDRMASLAAGELASLPGVSRAAWARRAPMSGSGGGATVPVEFSGQAPLRFHYNQVSPGYFSVAGLRLMRGRAFAASDAATATPVAMVSESFERRFFPSGAVGQYVRAAGKDRLVVGVAADAPANALREAPEPFLYFPYAQMPAGDLTLLVETAGDPAPLAETVRKRLKNSGVGVSPEKIVTLDTFLRAARREENMAAMLTGGLAALGLALAAAGLCGVILYRVERRMREFGIRLALGATRGLLGRHVLGAAASLLAVGIPAGLALALWAGRALRASLYGVSPSDPATLAAAAAVVAAVSVAATAAPAWRASRVDPARALRYE